MLKKIFIYSGLLLTIVIWGNAFVAIKYIITDGTLSPYELTVWRCLLVSVGFIPLILLRLSEFKDIIRKRLPAILGLGVTGTVGYHLALNFGEMTITAGTASLIIALSPSLAFLLSVLVRKEHFNWKVVSGLLISFIGLFIVIRWGHGEEISFNYILGALITLICPLCWAGYLVISEPLLAEYSSITVTGCGFFAGTIPLAIFMRPSSWLEVASIEPGIWLALIFLGFLAGILAYILWNRAVRELGVTSTSVFVYLIPLVSIFFSWIFLDEHVTFWLIIGTLMILLGVWLVNNRDKTQTS
jgi:drug/metabolite transporter (DMT)-like permease